MVFQIFEKVMCFNCHHKIRKKHHRRFCRLYHHFYYHKTPLLFFKFCIIWSFIGLKKTCLLMLQ